MTYAQIIDVVLQRLELVESNVLAITINRQTNTVTVLTQDMAKHKLAIPTEQRPTRKTTRKTDV